MPKPSDPKRAQPIGVDLANDASLRVFSGHEIVFESRGKWLHPLFELEDFLKGSGLRPESLRIEDKIIGRAAAFLIVRMGFLKVYGRTMSRLAESVFQSKGVEYSFGELVERIDCITESILSDVEEVERAYDLVRVRAGR
ncbi:MAG TPA: DUF1893 domain-containing protein [Spirochaetia bacterium]|nr:DUF1893 domain-containing protein [Spirochaetia bacterium]